MQLRSPDWCFPSGARNAAWVGCIAGHACKLHASHVTHPTQAPPAATPGACKRTVAMTSRPLTSAAHLLLQARSQCSCVPLTDVSQMVQEMLPG